MTSSSRSFSPGGVMLFSSRGARALREREREREMSLFSFSDARTRSLFFFIRFFLNRSIVGTPLGLCALLEKTSLRAAFFRCVGAYLVLSLTWSRRNVFNTKNRITAKQRERRKRALPGRTFRRLLQTRTTTMGSFFARRDDDGHRERLEKKKHA